MANFDLYVAMRCRSIDSTTDKELVFIDTSISILCTMIWLYWMALPNIFTELRDFTILIVEYKIISTIGDLFRANRPSHKLSYHSGQKYLYLGISALAVRFL